MVMFRILNASWERRSLSYSGLRKEWTMKGKRKPFIMQGICLFMLLFGMHLCAYSIFLKAGSLYKFAVALAAASLWFSFLAAAPFRRIEFRMKRRLKIPVIKYPAADFLLVLTLIIWGILSIRYMGHLQKDFVTLRDAVAYRQNVYYYQVKGTFDAYAAHRHGASGTWLLLDLELLAGLLMSRAFVHRHGMFLGTLPPVLFVAAGLLLGKAPTIPAMILLIAGILGVQMCGENHHKGGSRYFRQISVAEVRHWLFYPVMLVCILAILGVGARISLETKDKALQGEDKLLKAQHRVEREITDVGVKLVQKLQDLLGLEQPGIMTNASPNFTGKTVLTITVDEKPSEDIYLRGFIGTKYENGKWSNPSRDKLDSLFDSEKCYQLFTQDYTVYQVYAVVEKSDQSVDEVLENSEKLGKKNSATMKIKYAKDNNTTFAYFPYFSKLSSNSMGTLMLDHDRGFRRSDDVKSYEVTIQKTDRDISNMLKNADLLQKGYTPYYVQDKKGDSDGLLGSSDMIFYTVGNGSYKMKKVSADDGENLLSADADSYVQVSDQNLGKYYQYIMNEDLQLPRTGLSRTKGLAKKLLKNNRVTLTNSVKESVYTSSANEIIDDLRSYLSDHTEYSKQLKMKEFGTDYVENFLFVQKKGYCEHYATAGAVLFRAMGVPARYASGYRVPVSDFVDNGDGTYTAKVPDMEAHAWTEVYSLNTGWIVADLTPGAEGNTDPASDGLENNPDPTLNQKDQSDYSDDAFLENDPESKDKAASDTAEPEETEETDKPEETTLPDDSGDLSQNGNGNDDTSDGNVGADQTKDPSTISPELRGVLIKIAITATGLFIIWLLWYSQRLRRKRRLKKCHGAGAYLLEMNRQLEQMLHCCGYGRPGQMTDQEYIRLLGQIYPKGMEDGLIEKYYRQLEKARFDRESGTKEEIRECTRLIRGVKRGAVSSAKVWRRIYTVVIRGWQRK